MQQDLVALVTACTRDVLEFRGGSSPPSLTEDTVLFGPSGILDSAGLVTLVVAVEQAVSEKFGREISLADDRAMSQTHSPFRTVGTLAAYAAALVEEQSAR